MVEPNMTAEGMKRWKDTDAYAEYAEYHKKNIESGPGTSLGHVTHRAMQVILHGESSKYYEKVTGYNARAKAAFNENGPGQTKFSGVPKNIISMRCWGLDVYYQYTG